MNKLSRREYIKMIAEGLVKAYGDILKEGGTDVMLASRLVRKLKKFLFFRRENISDKEWKAWVKRRDPWNMNRDEED